MQSIISGHSFRELLDHLLFNAHRKYIASLPPLASTQTVVVSTSQVQVRSMPSLTPSLITTTSEKLPTLYTPAGPQLPFRCPRRHPGTQVQA